MNQKQYLFTDGSVDPRQSLGFGAYLHVNENDLQLDDLHDKISLKLFTDTSSTKLELETLLWALKAVAFSEIPLIIFTDCQNILGLERRRAKFEQNDYMTSKNIKIANHELYKEFYHITDRLDCQFVKVKGHKPKQDKGAIDRLFTLVDKASRNALRGL